ncbi:MAG: LysM peptidoglycan-binding domain-containing protein [Rhodocyclaceae bacterium]|nr:MAG: LysM peptidoglycan-binding domain-containing protein [Rhodocyclaceae bacterium]
MIIGLGSGSIPVAAATLLLAVMSLIGGCASQPPAPVIERSPPVTVPTTPAAPADTHAPSTDPRAGLAPGAATGTYTVKRGDTLLSIALENGQSYRDLAAWNNLEDPNKIQVGQQLRVKPPGSDAGAPVAVSKPIALQAPIETRPLGAGSTPNTDNLKREPRGGKLPYSEETLARLQKPDSTSTAEAKPEARAAAAEKPVDRPAISPAGEDAVEWAWPANGKLIANFVEGSNKGLDIAAAAGEPVLAAASGKVILVSSALRGYGNFVIVKHTTAYLSVYAHNSRILVKEEQQVTKGQKIAEIGSSDSDQPKLHFEIRHQGKPVDPLKFLPPR